MARKRSEQFKVLSLTLGLVLGWFFLPVAYKATLEGVFYEFQAPLWKSASQVRDLQSFWAARAQSRTQLIEAGVDLSRLNAAYRVSQQRNEALQQEIATLEEIFNLPPMPRHRVEVSRVVRRELSAWWQTFTIRKGEDYGIVKGAAVIDGDGVVGRVSRVYATTAEVELISSRSFRMAANFEGDTRPVTYQGESNTALGPAFGYVRDVPSDIRASEASPKRLISSRLGGVFPEGLFIGTVTELESDANGLFTEGTVRLSERLLDLREVAVLIPIEVEVRSLPQNQENGYVF